ncbi:metallophosphoesterase [Aeromonas rivipollensis]|uniref:metallophosphoesterase n=1 Tax=Aeromonas rivipollensis TaxID=948519 RepID=UPI003D21CD84
MTRSSSFHTTRSSYVVGERIISEPTNLFFIGDLHGQHDKLQALLKHVGFIPSDPYFAEDFAKTKLVFLGDLIDAYKGADHLATLEFVKSLCDAELAYCVMGNHEFNAVGWATRHPETGHPLRAHSDNNLRQHQLFLNEVGEVSSHHRQWIEWFKSLPLFYDFGHIRAIHACWHEASLARLRPYLNDDNSLKAEHWFDAFDKQHELYQLCETLLKGPELALPSDYSFTDKTGTLRDHIRVKWWLADATTYRQIAQVQPEMIKRLPDLPLPEALHAQPCKIPVVVGHYTLAGLPSPLSDKVICVDYNAAKASNELVMYRWWFDEDEPHRFEEENFAYLGDQEFGRQGLYAIRDMCQELKNKYPSLPLEEMDPVAIEAVKCCLMHYWDPAGVEGIEECADEYNGYLTGILTLALQGSMGELSAYLVCLTYAYFEQNLEPRRADRLAKHLIMLLNDYPPVQAESKE